MPTTEQAQRLEDRIYRDRPNIVGYDEWYNRRGRMLEARRESSPDGLAVIRNRRTT
jgi:hypothetical protein